MSLRYRKKPVIIEAYLISDTNDTQEIPKWLVDAVISGKVILIDEDKKCKITTLEGVMIGDVGDYIIQGIKGELYPCKPDIFIATYDKVD